MNVVVAGIGFGLFGIFRSPGYRLPLLTSVVSAILVFLAQCRGCYY